MHYRNTLAGDYAHIVEQIPSTFDKLSGKKLLITGASGFLGAYFIDIFIEHNKANPDRMITIVAVDNFRASLPERFEGWRDRPEITLLTHDVTQPLDGLPPFNFIIHAASIASPIFYREFPLQTIDVNVNGTWRMLDRAKADGAEAVLYFSSSEIYGNPAPDAIPTPESYLGHVSCVGPRACYDESKRLGETLSVSHHRAHGTPVKIVRPFNTFGPGQRLNDQRIVPDLMRAALSKSDLVLFSDGRPTRSFTYVRDFMIGTLLVMLDGPAAEPFNVGNDEELSIRQIADLMVEVAGERGIDIAVKFQSSADPDYLTDNPDRRCPDLTKMYSTFGWRPRVMAREGLSRTLDYYLETGAEKFLASK